MQTISINIFLIYKAIRRSSSLNASENNFPPFIDSNLAFLSCCIEKKTYPVHDTKENATDFDILLNQSIAFKIDNIFWANYQDSDGQLVTSSRLEYEPAKYIVINPLLVTPVDLECSLCYRLALSPC